MLELKVPIITHTAIVWLTVTTVPLVLPAATAPPHTSYVVIQSAILIVLTVHIPTTPQISVKTVVVIVLLV